MLIYDKDSVLSAKVGYTKISALRGEATHSAAFASNDTLTLTVRVPRLLCTVSAALELYRDDDMTERTVNAEKTELSDAHDIFTVTLKLSDICTDGDSGLFYYTFALDTPYGVIFVARDGSLTYDKGAVSKEQLTVYSDTFTVPDKFRGGMMYQIFVDRFFDGRRPVTPTKGKIRNPDWDNGTPMYAEKPGDALDNNEFFGGNLWGVADKLDYIASLGVDTLYLCPIFEAASNHKYDTGDYEKIDEMFGGEAAFDHLVKECQARRMKLILDGVFNHTGADSRYFNKFGNYLDEGAYNSKTSPFYKWYTFEDYPDKYRCWWGVTILPAVNSADESYREFICGENGVIRRYLRRGIDGWRLDVADELSDVFLDDLKSAARAEKPDALVIGEVWEDASNKIAYDRRRRYFRGKQLDSVMNYPLKESVINFVLTRNCRRLRDTARELWSHYPEAVSHSLMNFLGTHDTERILTVLADVGSKNMTNRELAGLKLSDVQRRIAKKRLMLAWALLCAFPGMPCIYYGDEAGMEGGRDPFNRKPYIWGREDEEILAFYRLIGSIRKSEPLFFMGDLEIIETENDSRFMLKRKHGDRTLIVAVNLGESEWMLEFNGVPKRLIEKTPCGHTVSLAADCIEYFVL